MFFELSGVFRRYSMLFLLVVAAITLSVTAITAPVAAVAGINQQLNFQGRLMNAQGAIVPDGFYNMQFKLYQDGIGTTAGNPGGTLLWTESWLNSAGNGVTVRNGYISVQLGSVTPFGTSVDWNQDTLWLSMNIGNTSLVCTPFASCVPDGEMVPMKRMTATPYAMNAGMVGGMKATDFFLLGKGLQTDAGVLNNASIAINKTGTGGLMQLQSSGVDVFSLSSSGDIAFGSNANHSITVAQSTTGTGKNLTIAAGTAASGGAASAGGGLVLRGGDAAGTGDANGGGVSIAGGSGTGAGVQGLVNIGASSFTTATEAPCTVDCTVSQTYVDSYSTVIVSATASPISITLPAPTLATQGRIVYVTTASGSQDFTLIANTGADLLEVTMKQNTTATMVWNGTAWTPGGASNAITLQATYNNATNPATTPEIKLDSIRGTIDIQDADTSIGADIFNIRASEATGTTLGTVLFGVSNTGRVTIQGTTDDSSAFRVLDPTGNYLFNINNSNGYVISNSIKSAGSEIVNPSFEAAGELSGGEEGWSGSAQGSIVSSGNAYNGNWHLQVIPNGTNLDYVNSSFFEVIPGDMLYLSGYVKASAGSNGSAGVIINWYAADKTTVLSSSSDYTTGIGTTYQQRRVNGTAPAGASFAKVAATVRSNATSGLYYFDNLYLKKSSEQAPMTFRNDVDSTTSFRIQSAGGSQTLLTANTSGNNIKIGDDASDTTILVLDSASADPGTLIGRNGGLFYNTTSGSIKAIVGGSVRDICVADTACSGYAASAGSSVALQSGAVPGSQQTGFFNISGTGYMSSVQTVGGGATSNTLTLKSGNATTTSGDVVIDTGTAGVTRGGITIGTGNVAVTMGGSLTVQGSNSLYLGNASSTDGSLTFRNALGANAVTLRAPSTNPTASYSLSLPGNATNAGTSGFCLKSTGGSGGNYGLDFADCAAGIRVTLQDAYDNSGDPGDPMAHIRLADGKDFVIDAQNTATDSNVLIDLQCAGTCATDGNGNTQGRFAVQQNGTDVLTVNPNGGDIVLGTNVQIGSGTTDANIPILLQVDSSTVSTGNEGPCGLTTNQGAMYYNTSMGSLRACINGSWGDVSNPDTLGLLTFGVVPSSGGSNNAYDLPSLINNGVSGPCKVSRASAFSVSIQACVVYSNGRRISVPAVANLYTNSATARNTSLTLAAPWGHVCIDSNGDASFTTTAGQTSALGGLPAFSPTTPIVCLADVKGVTTGTAGTIDDIYDVRTFTSTMKEAVNASTAVELGMLTDASTVGAMQPAVSASQKLYGAVVATDGSTSGGAPNVIVATVGPSWVKANSGSAGAFVVTSTTNGYARTNATIPNNSFYYSAGNTRTTFSTACTSASDCSGSLYVNFVVR